MNKKDLPIIVLLFALWLAWPWFDRQVIKKYFPAKARPAAAATTNLIARPTTVGNAAAPALTATPAPAPAAKPTAPASLAAAALTPAPAPAPTAPATTVLAPEQTCRLTNGLLVVTVSSHGATVRSAELTKYPLYNKKNSPAVVLDFQAAPALAYGLGEEFGPTRVFTLAAGRDGRSLVATATAPSGLRLQRTFSLGAGYQLSVTDKFTNPTAAGVSLPAALLQLGPMRPLPGETETPGVATLGVDSLSPGGEKVKYWSGDLVKWFGQQEKEQGLPKLPVTLTRPLAKPVDWVAAKDKYFVQILTPADGADDALVSVRRALAPEEERNAAFAPKMTPLAEASVAAQFAATSIAAGDTLTRAFNYYVGPKQYDALLVAGPHQLDVMELGMWAPVGKVLLKILNFIHAHVWPYNYGVAIMLLTIIIRIVFWPVTHKSTESMKKMQALQPLMAEMRAKYKDNPQRQQQAMMELYKEHKVNPLSGCLPMLVQIPVFIALFMVLRSAIELRFAPFLWVRDLSAPELLVDFGFSLPLLGQACLNVLPILMTVTMVWQQKLTPATGDPQQQKIMAFMPWMMLVFFYNMAAGLVLYWTTNQCLMIAQLILNKRKQAAKAAA